MVTIFWDTCIVKIHGSNHVKSKGRCDFIIFFRPSRSQHVSFLQIKIDYLSVLDVSVSTKCKVPVPNYAPWHEDVCGSSSPLHHTGRVTIPKLLLTQHTLWGRKIQEYWVFKYHFEMWCCSLNCFKSRCITRVHNLNSKHRPVGASLI
jgi:hypothetical protein